MKPDQIIQLTARLFSIYLLLILSFPHFMTLFFYAKDAQTVKVQAVMLLLITVVAGVFWFFPRALAHKILPKDDTTRSAAPVSFETIQALCFAVLGLWICVQAIVPLVTGTWSFVWGLFRAEAGNRDWGLVGHLLKLVLGLWVMLGAKGVMGLITRLQSRP